MTPEVLDGLDAELMGDEGLVLRVYDDATGKPIGPGSHVIGNPTVGVGRNLTARGIKKEEASIMLINDIQDCEKELATVLPWVAQLSTGRQIAMYSLYFNTAVGDPQHFVAGWPNFLKQMEAGQYDTAATNLSTTEPWISQVGPGRVARLTKLIRLG